MRVALLVGLIAILLAGLGAYALTRDGSIPVTVDGTHARVPAGSTLAQASERLELRPPAGDLVSVTGETLRSAAFPGRILVNGRRVTPDTELAPEDRLDVVPGRTRREPTDRVIVPVEGGVPANPRHTLARYPAMSVEKGRVSGELDRSTMTPTGTPQVPDAVALTFDDGPAEHTRAMLETLRRLGARATFFFVGERAERNPKLVRRARAYGMAVENHSYSHPFAPPFSERTRAEIDAEIARGADAIASLVDPPTLFRPPGGTYAPPVLEIARARGQHVVLWSVDPEDWRPEVTARQITRRVLGAVRPGSIVLLHDGPGGRAQTGRALPGIVRGIRARGLELALIDGR